MYVEFAYMTGVLPIAKYSSGSELNMFIEYDMSTKKRFSEYFGSLDSEVDGLFEIYERENEEPEITREDLRIWYDGYYTAREKKMYNPRSIVCSLMDNELANYWTSSGTYDEIFYYIRNNIEEVRDDLVLMIAGEGYVDFIFYPERKTADTIILELKVDLSPEEAIRQIKKKNYALCLKGKFEERPKYTGRILAVGISYSGKTKEHFCKVEVLS